VGVRDGITKTIGPKVNVQFRGPAEFGKPKTMGDLSKGMPERGKGYLDLSLYSLGTGGINGKECVGSCGGQDFKTAFLLIIIKYVEYTAFVPFGKKDAFIHHPVVIKPGQPMEVRIILRSLHFPDAEFNLLVHVIQVMPEQVFILKHVTQKRGKGNTQAEGNMVLLQMIKNLQKGKVGVRKGLKKPLFFHGEIDPGEKPAGRFLTVFGNAQVTGREHGIRVKEAVKLKGYLLGRSETAAFGGGLRKNGLGMP
jgi:hypothetical protein